MLKLIQLKTSRFTHFPLIALGFVILAGNPSAQAQLVAYEGFDYTAGTQINAQSGGTGWGLNWSIPSVAGTNVATGLSYGALITSGGRVEFGPAAATLVYTRQLGATLGASAASGHLWTSLLYLNAATSTTAEARIGFYSGLVSDGNGNTATAGATQVVNVGRAASGSDVISLYNGATINSTGVATPRGASPAFLLLRFDLDGGVGNDTLNLWVNPDLSLGESGLGTAQATWATANLDFINGLRFQTPATTGIFDIDELRIGGTFADVTPLAVVPEPATAALVAFGSLALIVRRRLGA